MNLDGPILLYGAGREGRSTRRFLLENAPDAEVHVVVDKGDAKIPDTLQIPVENLENLIRSGAYDLIVRSAGVSRYKPALKAAENAGIAITTNVNLWSRFKRADSTVIAITGTKGKSTTTKLIHTILLEAGMDAGLAGNIGVPPLDIAPHKIIVLELSSFQCADLDLNPDFIGITSLFPEHLDWHLNEANYFSDKLNILRRSKPYQCAITPQVAKKDCLPQPPSDLVHRLDDLSPDFEDRLRAEVARSALKGEHNVANATLAARISLGVGASKRDVLAGIARFVPLPHRLEEIALGAKRFVNDSIATNPEATKAAIAAYPEEKVALIVGGYDRGQNYVGLVAALQNSSLAQVWFLPDTGHRIAATLDPQLVPFAIHQANSLPELFEQVSAHPDQFDVLILSPGAPSYNQFDNFEQRGTSFLELARKHFDQ